MLIHAAFSAEHRKRISIANTGKKRTAEMIAARSGEHHHYFGKHRSEEIRHKISCSLRNNPRVGQAVRGRALSEEHKEKIRQSTRGRLAWNKDISIPLTQRKKISTSLKGRHHSVETKQKLSDIGIARINRNFKDTAIESKMKKMLDILDIDYYFQYPIKGIARVDFYIHDKNLIVECDGCYWHGCPTHNPERASNRDAIKTAKFKEKGYSVLRLWEHDINTMEVSTLLSIINSIWASENF